MSMQVQAMATPVNPVSPRRLERRHTQTNKIFSKEHPLSVNSDIVLVASDGAELHVHRVSTGHREAICSSIIRVYVPS